MKLKTKTSVEEAIKKTKCFNPTLEDGLSSAMVSQRIKEGLVNFRKKRTTKSIGKIFFDNLLNPLNVILLVMFILMITAKLPVTSFFFIVILASNSILGLIQDFNARRLVSKLSIMTEQKTTVIRDKNKIEISTDELVYEDIVFLSLGDQVPTDCVVKKGNCSVNESLLTGESLPVNKTEKDILYSGSYLTSGKIQAKAVKVGAANYVETLQEKAAQFKRPDSEIKKTINLIMVFSVICVVIFGAFYTTTFLLKIDPSKTYFDYAKETSGSLVSMIPAGMYLLTSLTLAVGVIALAKRRMLVQQLYCIEMLARVDLVCLDKTGTLTDGDMKVEEVIPVGKATISEVHSYLKNIIYCTGDTNPTSLAMMDFLPKDKEYKSTGVINFDSAKKYAAVQLEDNSTLAVGAYGFVNCIPDKKIEDLIQSKSKEGYRVVCVFTNKKPFKNGNMPMISKLVGLVCLSNSIKKDAPANIKWFQANNVGIKIISGDNPYTVSHIAKICGVFGFEKFINCENLSDEELVNVAKDTVVFGRVSPEQKELLIKTFKSQGHTVAMTGDGVNDILALKAADCSIAMANGSSAARNVAHIVSLDSDFAKLPNVVEEGRRVINNLQRSCSLFLSKTMFAVLISIIMNLMWFFNRQGYPFSTNNMMIWEMVSIGFASFFLALQPSRERLKGSFTSNILYKTIPAGIAEVLSVVLIFSINAICYKFGYTNIGSYQTMCVLAFTIVSYVVLGHICSPFDLYRILVYIGCLVAGGVLVVLDYFVFKTTLLGLEYSSLSLTSLIIVVLVVILCSGTYFLLNYFVDKRLKNKQEASSL